MYHAELLDHYKNPRHKGTLENKNFSSDEFNPSCGDRVIFHGIVTDTILTNIAFTGTGCVISQATASLLAQHVYNRSVHEILTFDTAYIQTLVAIPLGPVRLRCALLALDALHKGIQEYLKKGN